jgi:nitrogen fixation protein FixH
MNWGTKIVLGMVVFMLFIIGMVVYMFKVHDNDSLVEEDYYEKGLNYNQEYKAKENVLNEGAEPVIKINEHQIIIQLKDSASYELKMMRPVKAAEDIKSKGNTIGTTNLILVERANMHRGLWILELKWMSNNKEYQFNKNITL